MVDQGKRKGWLPRLGLALCWCLPAGLAAELIRLGGAASTDPVDLTILAVLTVVSIAAAILMTRASAGAYWNAHSDPDRRSKASTQGRMDTAIPLIFHEIKNYASTLKGNTLLLRRDFPDGAKPSLERLEQASERISGLAKEVLDLSLLGKPSEPKPIDLVELVKQCASRYFDERGVAFAFNSDRGVRPVMGEAVKLEQVFLNLFKNSLEAEASRITISLHAQQARTGVMIEDDGKGCTSAEVEKMFEAYHSVKRSKGGSGLGLFLVKAIVEGHGGTITGFSKNHKVRGENGMMFILNFPAIPPQSNP